jgi:type VI secretion system ImpB/VipA family protein
MNVPFVPLKILALAPFLGPDCPVWGREPLGVDPANVDQAIEEIGPTSTVSVPCDLYPEGNLEIPLRKVKDFHPDSLVQNIPGLRNLWEAKAWMEEARKRNLSPQEINGRLAQWLNLPPIRVETAPQKSRAASRESLDKILDMVALPDEQSRVSAEGQEAIGRIDGILKGILTHIFSDETFRTLEASWRGLNLVLRHLDNGSSDLRIEILPVSSDSLDDTLGALTAEVIDELPSVVLVDLPFDNTPRSLELLGKVAQFSETLLIPAITWIRPAFFHIDTWWEIKKLPFLPHYLEEPPFAKWQSLKKAPAGRWLTVTCSRFLARYPYGKDNTPRRIYFEEHSPLWISPVWALGNLMGRSFIETGWPTRFTDWQRISIEDLPLNTEDPEKPLPTEAYFDRDRIDQLIRSGIMPLASLQGKDCAFVPDETVVGGVSLGYQLFVSRITQLVLWCRDHLEKGIKGADLEAELRQAFGEFWERTGHQGPENLMISAAEPTPDGRIPVRITLEPSRQILPSREKVELDFLW